MNDNDYSNIMFINFEPSIHLNNEVNNMTDYLSEFILEKDLTQDPSKKFDIELENIFNDSFENSFYSDFIKSIDSCSSIKNITLESLNYYSDDNILRNISQNSSYDITDDNNLDKNIIACFINNPKPSIKKYRCSYQDCKKDFKLQTRYSRHSQAHLTIKAYKCSYPNCSKVYKSRENLNLHVKNIHNMLKPYKCQYCLAIFSHRNGNLLLLI